MPFTLIKTPPQGGHGTPARWDFAFDDILSYRNNRLVVMQNWDSLWVLHKQPVACDLWVYVDDLLVIAAKRRACERPQDLLRRN